MMLRYLTALISFICCIALLMLFSSCGDNRSPVETAIAKRVLSLSIAVQLPLESDTALPVVCQDDLILADDSGYVVRLNSILQPIWRITLEKASFANSGAVISNTLVLSSSEGNVFCLNPDNGDVLWKKTFDATFTHPPLCGSIGGEPALWLLSQSDGAIYALKAANGMTIWSSEETNRSDGNAVLWAGTIAYGNCDGAVYLFNALTGVKLFSVPIGESDQMAGTPLVTQQGVLWIGTREGKLALVDLTSRKLISTLDLSEEEAFVQPVSAFDNRVAMGVSEGVLSLCSVESGKVVVDADKPFAFGIDSLIYDGSLLYVFTGGILTAVNSKLKTEASLNIGDDLSGAVLLGDGLLAVIVDKSLLLIKGEWK
ncbi:MAG: PQQ-binding-like beta-propeller repeat protein [Kiritimatiellae bacterium]|jgi:outer membrane protein assembly factor BamB|nr:PQQ-binding-like beta-propeller repeat protein [Kiritimatiellia bacterium]